MKVVDIINVGLDSSLLLMLYICSIELCLLVALFLGSECEESEPVLSVGFG